jgi:hypothetical protein
MPGPSMSDRISWRKWSSSTLSTLAAILSGIPAARAILIARSGRFSGEIRPRKARYLPRPNDGRCKPAGMPWWIVATKFACGEGCAGSRDRNQRHFAEAVANRHGCPHRGGFGRAFYILTLLLTYGKYGRAGEHLIISLWKGIELWECHNGPRYQATLQRTFSRYAK